MKIAMLIYLFLIVSLITRAESVKLVIKHHNADLCIRVKDSSAILDKCHWKLHGTTTTTTQEMEQTFDVHPEDVGQEDVKPGETQKTSFLIRISAKQRNRKPNASPFCLSSVSLFLTSEKCSGKKSRFRFSGFVLPTESKCRSQTQPMHDFRYTLHSYQDSCLEMFGPANNNNNGSKPTLSFSECASNKTGIVKSTQLWQFCSLNGNCSLSPSQLNWSSLIKTQLQADTDKTNCAEVESNASSQSQQEGEIVGDLENSSSDSVKSTETPLPHKASLGNLTESNTGKNQTTSVSFSGSSLISRQTQTITIILILYQLINLRPSLY